MNRFNLDNRTDIEYHAEKIFETDDIFYMFTEDVILNSETINNNEEYFSEYVMAIEEDDDITFIERHLNGDECRQVNDVRYPDNTYRPASKDYIPIQDINKFTLIH
jgi:hypothetical protein